MPNSDWVPSTDEEFKLWMVQKVGATHTMLADVAGDLKVRESEHNALKERVVSIESDQKSAKRWENGKFLVSMALTGLLKIFSHK